MIYPWWTSILGGSWSVRDSFPIRRQIKEHPRRRDVVTGLRGGKVA